MTTNEKRNIYNAIQNLYNMDFTTWQEVLAMLYNLVADVEQKFDKLEAKFTLLLGKEVAEAIKKMHESGELAEIINQEIFSDLNNKIDEIKTSILNTLNVEIARVDKEIEKVNEQLDNIEKYADMPTYNLNHITKEMGVTDGIQYVFNLVNETGIGRILLDKVYEIDKPLVLERTNTNTNTSIEIYGGGCIKKSSNFTGDRLLLLKIGYHDEDNIVFNNISFDGVDHTVNGVDTFDFSLPYNLECSDKSQHNESKFVKFNDCSFNNCYCGARLSSLSWVFNGCLFEFNRYGLYLDCSANVNAFFGCSIRQNIVGVKIKQFDSTIGTIANSFYNCTIESNKNLGVLSIQSQHTKLIGCYFENNGTNIDNNFEKHNDNKSCHILLNDAGGAGCHTIDCFFSPVDYNISGVFLNSLIKNGGKINIQLATDTNFISQYLNAITFTGFGSYTSSFSINGEKYKSTSDTKKLYKEKESPGSFIYKKDKEYTLFTLDNQISTNTCKLCDITINEISNGFIDFNAILIGRNAGGSNISTGLITGKIGLIKATNGTNNYTACVSGLKFINCDGAPSGSGGKTAKIFTESANISVSNNLNTVTLTLNGIDTSSMINWGSITKIDIGITATYCGIASPRPSSFEVLSLS